MVEKLYTDLYSPLTGGIGNSVDSGGAPPTSKVTTPVITITDDTATITCETEKATIYYTLDGSTPTSASTAYSSAITLTQSCTIKAIAVKSGMTDSAVASESYVAIQYLTAWRLVGNSEVKTLPYPDGVVLPNGYKRCEYLTFDGSSYIDTNTTIDADTIVETAASTNTTLRWLLGSRTADASGRTNVCIGMFGYGGVSDKLLGGHGSTNNQILTGSNLLDNTKHSLIIENGKLTFDSVEYSLSTLDEYNSNTIFIGALKLQDGTPHSNMWKGNIYDTIIYNTQGELWHGIPCLDANDVPCFYDLVSQTAFYNQGSGSFTYKLYPQPTEIWSCGELGNDDKYHIYISNGASVYDIELDEPLRKYSTAADKIEYANSVATLTREVEEVDGELDVLDTPTTEIITVPQIEVSSTDTYTQIISQGAKAVEWTSFTPNPEEE